VSKSASRNSIQAIREHPLEIAEFLAGKFAHTAIERDIRGGTAKAERDQLRNSGLLSLLIPRAEGGFGSEWPGDHEGGSHLRSRRQLYSASFRVPTPDARHR